MIDASRRHGSQASQFAEGPGARIPRGTRGGTVYLPEGGRAAEDVRGAGARSADRCSREMASPPHRRWGGDARGAWPPHLRWGGSDRKADAQACVPPLRNVPTTNLIIRHFKNTMIGLSQGWSINLELKGIGFTGKIEQQGLRPSPSGDQQEGRAPLPPQRGGIGGTSGGHWVPTVGSNACPGGARGAGVPANRRKGGWLGRTSLLSEAPTTCAERALVRAAARRRAGVGEDPRTSAGTAQPHRGLPADARQGLREAKVLVLNLGFSHEVFYHIPQHSVAMRCGANVGQGPSTSPNQVPTISIAGISKNRTNQVASDIYRSQRGKKPEPYKGKGIRYDGERFFAKTSENSKKG